VTPRAAAPAAADPGVQARRVAIEALVRIERDDAYANLALDAHLRRSGLDRRDRALVTDLVYGTLRRRRACDFLVDRFLSSPPPAEARAALRVGAYQLHFTDTPAHAAVSATVSAVPKRYRGVTNAVLRRVSAEPVTWPDDATRLSYPDWIVDRLVADLGHDDALAALEAMDAAPEVSVRDDGYTQDRASQWVAAAVGVRAGDVVADVCAAPGGKATLLAERGARVIAADLRPARAGLVATNAARVGVADRLLPLVADATSPPIRPGSLDAVLVDAPCSGLGVLHRRADARWRAAPGDVEQLAGLQGRILAAAIPLVRPGGTVAYSVCTVTRAETLDHDEWVARTHPALRPLGVPIDDRVEGGEGLEGGQGSEAARWRPWGTGALVLPQDAGTDGMALFRWQVPSAP
jgi:16S rRNA (cytosine967-C5)-methyltransferase